MLPAFTHSLFLSFSLSLLSLTHTQFYDIVPKINRFFEYNNKISLAYVRSRMFVFILFDLCKYASETLFVPRKLENEFKLGTKKKKKILVPFIWVRVIVPCTECQCEFSWELVYVVFLATPCTVCVHITPTNFPMFEFIFHTVLKSVRRREKKWFERGGLIKLWNNKTKWIENVSHTLTYRRADRKKMFRLLRQYDLMQTYSFDTYLSNTPNPPERRWYFDTIFYRIHEHHNLQHNSAK